MSKILVVSVFFMALGVMGGKNGRVNLHEPFNTLLQELDRITDNKTNMYQSYNNCYNRRGKNPSDQDILDCSSEATKDHVKSIPGAVNDETKKQTLAKISQEYINVIGAQYFQEYVPLGYHVLGWLHAYENETPKLTLQGDHVCIYYIHQE